MDFERRTHPVVYKHRLVAIAGRRRCHLVAELDEPELRFVLAMCLYYREVEAGRAPGLFDCARAEAFAAALISATLPSSRDEI